MAAQLNTQTVNTNFHTPQTIYQGSGNFKLEVPQSTVMVAKPLSYDFRVVEYADNLIHNGMDVKQAYIKAAERMAIPVLSATVGIIIVYLPLLHVSKFQLNQN